MPSSNDARRTHEKTNFCRASCTAASPLRLRRGGAVAGGLSPHRTGPCGAGGLRRWFHRRRVGGHRPEPFGASEAGDRAGIPANCRRLRPLNRNGAPRPRQIHGKFAHHPRCDRRGRRCDGHRRRESSGGSDGHGIRLLSGPQRPDLGAHRAGLRRLRNSRCAAGRGADDARGADPPTSARA